MTVEVHALDHLVEIYKVPTQTCCLAHISAQLVAMERGAPVDLLFQSIAGTEAVNRSFGISLAMLRESRERVLELHRGRALQEVSGAPTVNFSREQIPPQVKTSIKSALHQPLT